MNSTNTTTGRVELRYLLNRPAFALDVDLEIPRHGITGVLGASGSGKTTLLRCIAGLEKPTRGRLVIDGETWEDTDNNQSRRIHDRQIGYVFQEARLFDHLSVLGNLEYGLKRRGPAATDTSLEQVVELLGLAGLLSRKPRELSGGEAQRVAIGRALLRAPRLMLMDEPLAALDRARKDEILPFLDRLHGELSLPIIYVSHSIEEIARLCDYLVTLDNGRSRASGELQTMLTNPELALEHGQDAGTVVDAQVADYEDKYGLSRVTFSGGTLWIPGRFTIGQQVRIRIRADDISLCRTRPEDSTILNILPVHIVKIRQSADGPFAQLLVTAGQDRLSVRLTRRSCAELDLQEGDEVLAQIKSVAVRHF